MTFSRREFIQVLAASVASGISQSSLFGKSYPDFNAIYDAKPFGNVHLLHITDCHAQLNPIYYREPSVNIGVGAATNKFPHIVGENFLQASGVEPGSALAHAFTCQNFVQAAELFGKVGGFAHLKTLINKVKSTRPDALLLDGGDTWQGSGTALWTEGQDMVEACLELGVDVMTAHWEMMHGAERVKHIVDNDFQNKVDFIAQNIKTRDFEDPVFDSYTLREMNGIPVAIIGQAFPYTPIANPQHFTPDWSFGIREFEMQETVNRARIRGAQVVVLLSHNGMDVDLKLASRVTGIDAILGGHTHDAIPNPIIVGNKSGKTIVTNAGSNGKFLGVLDFSVKSGHVVDFEYRLLPVFSNAITPDLKMAALIERLRKPYMIDLSEELAVTEGTLYRRGNFNGSFDEVLLDAMLDEQDAEIAFSPGFRWGTSLLPGTQITMESLLEQTATTYSYCTQREMTGAAMKEILEDVADNIFNPDPYYQQGGDMVRVGGMSYSITPSETIGSRIDDMRIGDELVDPNKKYKVAGWAPVSPNANGEYIWDLVSRWLKEKKVVKVKSPNQPTLKGLNRSLGISRSCVKG